MSLMPTTLTIMPTVRVQAPATNAQATLWNDLSVRNGFPVMRFANASNFTELLSRYLCPEHDLPAFRATCKNFNAKTIGSATIRVCVKNPIGAQRLFWDQGPDIKYLIFSHLILKETASIRQTCRNFSQLQWNKVYTSLDFTGWKLVGFNHFVSRLAPSQTIKAITISSISYFRNDDLQLLLKQCSKVETVKMKFLGNITDGALRYLEPLPNLTSLELMYCSKITGRAFFTLLKLKLINLNIYDCAGVTSHFKLLSEFKHLKDLSVYDSNITPEAFSASSQLTSFSIGRCQNLQNDLKYLDNLINVTYLNLPLIEMTNSTFHSLAKLPLKTLRLSGAKGLSSDKNSEGLSVLSQHKTLRKLCVNVTDLDDSGLQTLSGLPQLTDLNVALCPNLCWDHKYLDNLVNITRLKLMGIKMQKATFYSLASLPLKTLCLTGAEGLNSDKNSEGVSLLSRNKTLRELSVCKTDLDDTGLLILSGLSQLKEIDCGFCKSITKAGIKAFKAKSQARVIAQRFSPLEV